MDAGKCSAEPYVGGELVEFATDRDLARIGADIGDRRGAVIGGSQRVGNDEAFIKEPLENRDCGACCCGMTRRVGRMLRTTLRIGQRKQVIAVSRKDCGGGLRTEEAAVERITLGACQSEMYQTGGFLRTQDAMDEPFLEPRVLERACDHFSNQHLDLAKPKVMKPASDTRL